MGVESRTGNISPSNILEHAEKMANGKVVNDTLEKWYFNVKQVLNAPAQKVIWSFITNGVNNALVASSEAGKSTLLLNLANWP